MPLASARVEVASPYWSAMSLSVSPSATRWSRAGAAPPEPDGMSSQSPA